MEIPGGGWKCSSSSHISQYSKLCRTRTSEGRRNTFAVFQDHQFSLWKIPRDSANVFWKGKVHYGCGFNVNRGHKSMRKMEGDAVNREHLVPILVLVIINLLQCWDLVFTNRGGQIGDVKVKVILSSSNLEMEELRILRGGSRTRSRITTGKKITVGKRSLFHVLGLFPWRIVFQKANLSSLVLLVILLKTYDKPKCVAFMLCPNTSVS